MKLLFAVAAVAVIAASVVFLGKSASEYSARPSQTERNMQELKNAVDDLKAANKLLQGN